jgi:hypothetical protein
MQIKRKSIESGVKSFKAAPLYSLSAAKKGWRGTKKIMQQISHFFHVISCDWQC